MDPSLLTTILGTVASVAGLAIAAVQSIRLRELQRRAHADVWHAISTAQSAIRNLERSPALKDDPSVSQAYAKAGEIFKHLLKQAVLAERKFSEATVQQWVREEKIQGAWQTAQARKQLYGDQRPTLREPEPPNAA
jgi:hypothetical protein